MKKLLLSFIASFCMMVAFATNGDLTVNPKSGSTIGKLDAVTITFNDKESATPLTSLIEDAVVSDASGYALTHLKVQGVGNKAIFSLVNEITAAGTYTITIPASTIAFDFEFDAAGEPLGVTDANDMIVLKYTVDPNLNTGGGDSHSPIAFNPANGSTVEVFSGFDITFNKATTVEFNKSVFGEDSYLWVYGGGIEVASIYVNNLNLNGALTKHINLASMGASTLTEEGVYTITFPEGTWTIDGEASEELVYSFTIGKEEKPEPLEVKVTLTPEADAIVDGPVAKVEVAFEGCDEVMVAGNSDKVYNVYGPAGVAAQFTAADIRQANGALSYGIFFNAPEGFDGNWTGLVAPGNYTLNLPAGLFLFVKDEEIKGESEVISYTFSINAPDGIQNIQDNTLNITYGIDGRRANKGIVISGGKKIVR